MSSSSISTAPESSDVICDLKAHARVLHRRATAGDPVALRRARMLSELKKLSDDELMQQLKRRQCLSVVARQLGFVSWEHARAVLSSRILPSRILSSIEQQDFGTLLYPGTCSGHYNIWSASYAEAREIRAAHGGYLLAYKRQFLIVEDGYIDSMGLDPADPDWERMGRDWVQPGDFGARERLYRKLVHNALVTLTLEGN
jgi:hypothetical protein